MEDTKDLVAELKKLFGEPKDFSLSAEDIAETFRRYAEPIRPYSPVLGDYKERPNPEDYREGDSSLFVPGTYLQIIRQAPYLMGDGLFGYTTPSMGLNVVVRSDLRGEAFRRVRDHEAYHHTQRASEGPTRDATGTHMHEFLPIFEKTKYSI